MPARDSSVSSNSSNDSKSRSRSREVKRSRSRKRSRSGSRKRRDRSRSRSRGRRRRSRSRSRECKVYVGNLGNSASKSELEDEFEYYGKITSVWVARSPPGFAYIIFEDSQDAKDAVRGLDGKMICGHRVKVDLSNNVSRSRPRPPPPRPYYGDRFGGRFGGRFGAPHTQKRCYTCDRMGHISRDCPKFRR